MVAFDGVYELRIYYTCTPSGFASLQHRMTHDVRLAGTPVPGDEIPDINAETRVGGAVPLDEWVTSVVNGMKTLYPSNTDINRAELWKIPEGTYDATFISVMEIAANGTNAGAETPAHQATFTFRSSLGGHSRIQLMESSLNLSSRQAYPYTSVRKAFADIFTANSSCMLARDNGNIIASINLSEGQNEKLFRKRYRG